MSRTLSLAFLLAAASAHAQLVADPGQVQAVKDSLKSYKQALAPAQADRKVAAILYERLARDKRMDGVEDEDGNIVHPQTEVGKPDKKGRRQDHSIALVEIPLPERPLDPAEPNIVDLVERHLYSHLIGRLERWTPLAEGEYEVDVWEYVVSLDGKILSVVHEVLVGVPLDAEGFLADPGRSSSVRMSPSDPSVLKRWKRMSERFLRLGGLEV